MGKVSSLRKAIENISILRIQINQTPDQSHAHSLNDFAQNAHLIEKVQEAVDVCMEECYRLAQRVFCN